MAHELRYGIEKTIPVHFPENVRLLDFSLPRGEPAPSIEQAVIDALASPLGFSSLNMAVVAGDHVVVPVAEYMPHASAVVAGVVRSLVAAGCSPRDITVLSVRHSAPEKEDTEDDPPSPLLQDLPDDLRVEVRVAQHDHTDFVAMAYLAATKEGDPIYVNRLISDADIVIPIGLMTITAMREGGIFNGLFPSFSDRETQRRFRASDKLDAVKLRKKRRDETNEVGWWLGIQLTVQVIPGSEDKVLHVLAGTCEAVNEQGKKLCKDAWKVSVPQQASIVLASIEGGPDQQTWENFSKALNSASSAVQDDGVIVLCTSLENHPGPLMQRLINWSPDDSIPKQIRRERSPDALAAMALAETRQRARLFLLSKLEEETVEDLGIGYIGSPEAIDRLCRKHESCIMLSNAQHAVVTIDEE